jgi:hypothetical protein
VSLTDHLITTLLVVLLVAAATVPASSTAGGQPAEYSTDSISGTEGATVIDVTDGDTIDIVRNDNEEPWRYDVDNETSGEMKVYSGPLQFNTDRDGANHKLEIEEFHTDPNETVTGDVSLGQGAAPDAMFENVTVVLYDKNKEEISRVPVGKLSTTPPPLTQRINITTDRIPEYVVIESPDFWQSETTVYVNGYKRPGDGGRYEDYSRANGDEKFPDEETDSS